MTEPTTATPPSATAPAASRRQGPVLPTEDAIQVFAPGADARITGGFWAARQQANRDHGIPDGHRQLHSAGNIANLDAAAAGTGPLRPGMRIDLSASGFGANSEGYHGPVFMDSDVYKWAEAAAWESQARPTPELLEHRRSITGSIAAAQDADGYLDSFVQVVSGSRFADLAASHELYCAGHLAQAAVAAERSSGDPLLLDATRRFADLLDSTFGPGGNQEVDGHPIIEMALVELFRSTGERRYLDLASWAVERRGRGSAAGTPGGVYYSDRVPVREATSLEGHAVRALYLAAGATDVAVETGDTALLEVLERQWEAVVAEKTYVTGGMGSRWEGESFGAPFELPADRAYAETCAAIASIQWSHRLLLATGRSRYADLIERTLYNGMLAGVSLGGDEFFYTNTMHLRTGAVPSSSIDPALGRRRWFSTACCPPNVMRTLAQLDHYVATADERGIQVQQYAAGTIADSDVSLEVDTRYPYDGAVRITVDRTSGAAWTLALRIPAWAEGASAKIDGEVVAGRAGSYLEVRRSWQQGDVVELTLPLDIRVTHSHPRVDATRGAIAIERGPLVYCLEQVDQPDVDLDALTVVAAELARSARPVSHEELLEGTTTIEFPSATGAPLTAVPYALWANRGVGPMRVWLPTSR